MPSSGSGSLPETSESTRQAITLLLRHGPMARSELARKLSLSKGALTKMTKPLLEIGLLTEGSTAERGSVGRPVLPLSVNAGWSRFVGVKLTDERSHGVLTHLSGSVIRGIEAPLPGRERADVLALIIAQVNDLVGGAPAAGMGVSLARGAAMVAMVDHLARRTQ